VLRAYGNQKAETLGHKDIPAAKALGTIQFAMVAYMEASAPFLPLSRDFEAKAA
jgi:hypothetical protein